MTTSCWGVVIAAGRGERFGEDRPKALVELAGRPLVVHAVRALHEGGCDGVVVAAPADLVSTLSGVLTEFGCEVDQPLPGPTESGGEGDRPLPGPTESGGEGDRRLQGSTESGGEVDRPLQAPAVIVVAGGPTRQASVSACLAEVPIGVAWVLVHDAARPLVPAAVVASVRTTLAAGAPAVIPVLRVVDTIKSVDAAGEITATVDRSVLRAAQTPQGFERDLLVRALAECAERGEEVTDDAAAVVAMGVPVLTVPGDARGLKITTTQDLIIAEALAIRSSSRS